MSDSDCRLTVQVAGLVTGPYEVVLQVLSRYYIHHGETAGEFDILARTAKHLMNWVMREVGPVLTALPVGPSHPGLAAGPAFDIARPSPSCCRTRTRPGRSSKNGSMRWSGLALPSASKRVSAHSPRLPARCTR